MADLTTKYMGIKLKNPLIVASSGLTASLEGIQRCSDAGAGAIVLKSMFEELIVAQSEKLDNDLIQSQHPEAYEYVKAKLGMRLGPRPYLKFIEDVRRNITIPIIASVNCISPKWWVSYAKNIESAGADGIELNISHFPVNPEESSKDIEQRYIRIVEEVTNSVTIPVAVKIGFNFTSLWSIIKNIDAAGAQAIVLFNRYNTDDVDLKRKTLINSMSFSSPHDFVLPLKWTGFLADKLECDIAASTGIHDSDTIIKMIMVGSTVVQLCSILYKKGPEHLTKLLDDVNTWLNNQSYLSIGDIRAMALKNTNFSDVTLKRLQYVKSLMESSKL